MMEIATPERDATLSHVLELLRKDSRIEAVVFTGSLGAQRMDRWSDLDMAGVVAGHESCEVVAADWVALMYRDLRVAHHYETEFGTTLVRGFLLDSGVVVDLAFTPLADFTVWAPVRVAFDRTGAASKTAESFEPWAPTPDWRGEAGFAWHDVLHACAATSRRRPWQALYFLQRIRNRTLALASERHGQDSDEFKYVDDLAPAERDPLLASLVTDLRGATLLAAIEVATRAFLDELRRGDPALADRLTDPLLGHVQASRDLGLD